MPKQSERRPRSETVRAKTLDEVDSISITFDGDSVRFGQPMTDVHSEISFERPEGSKGPKVLSRIPQANPDISFSPSAALERNYEVLAAVDTNTKTIAGKRVSVVAIVMAQRVWAQEAGGLARFWQYFTPFCLEFISLRTTKAENFGWIAAYEQLIYKLKIVSGCRLGMIVDSDLGNLEAFNGRKQPVIDERYLPKGVTLIYASSDAGKERFINRLFGMADATAKQIIIGLESGVVPFNPELTDHPLYEGCRILYGRQPSVGPA